MLEKEPNDDSYKLLPSTDHDGSNDRVINNTIIKENCCNSQAFNNFWTPVYDPTNKSLDDWDYIPIPSNTRWVVFSFFLISNILISMDHGSLPASTEQLRQWTSHEQSIGWFGSFVYVGNVVGSIIIFTIINYFDRKTLLLFSLLFNAVLLYTFIVFSNIFFWFCNRFLVGVFQAYITIYLPVWCNQYGHIRYRTLMIAFVQWASPIGIFFGYFVASVFIQNDLINGWKNAFIIQAYSMVILLFVFALVPKIYFDKNIINYTDDETEEEHFIQSSKTTRAETVTKLPFWTILTLILEKRIYLFSILGLASLYYVISGVTYWISDYMNNIMGITNPKTRWFYFTWVCFTSPTLGVLLGTLTKDLICKTNMKKSLIFCCFWAVFSWIPALMVPFVSNMTLFCVLMWLVLFFGGGVVPIVTNITIEALPEKWEASGNSISNLICNILGYLPAPYIYGILSDIFNDKGLIGMTFTMWVSIIGVIFLFLATIYKSKMNEKDN